MAGVPQIAATGRVGRGTAHEIDEPSKVMGTLASRLVLCRVLLVMLVSMQVAVAALACPAGPSETAGPDAALASLCSDHHEQGQQSADRSPIPVPVGSFGGSWLRLTPVDDARPVLTSAAERWPIPAQPPHSILHCCLRA
jgi:hypothetical protein